MYLTNKGVLRRLSFRDDLQQAAPAGRERDRDEDSGRRQSPTANNRYRFDSKDRCASEKNASTSFPVAKTGGKPSMSP